MYNTDWIDTDSSEDKWAQFNKYVSQYKLFKYQGVYFYPELREKAENTEAVYRDCMVNADTKYEKLNCLLRMKLSLLNLLKRQYDIYKDLDTSTKYVLTTKDFQSGARSKDIVVNINGFKLFKKQMKLIPKKITATINEIQKLLTEIKTRT